MPSAISPGVRDAIENQNTTGRDRAPGHVLCRQGKSISSKLPIAGYHGIPLLEMTEAKWKAAERQFPLAVAAWRQGQRVMAIAQVDPRKEKRGPVAEVINLALMQVTQNWIPVDSSYEQIIADKLTARTAWLREAPALRRRRRRDFPRFHSAGYRQRHPDGSVRAGRRSL